MAGVFTIETETRFVQHLMNIIRIFGFFNFSFLAVVVNLISVKTPIEKKNTNRKKTTTPSSIKFKYIAVFIQFHNKQQIYSYIQ